MIITFCPASLSGCLHAERICVEKKLQKQQWAEKPKNCFKSCGVKSWAPKFVSATRIKGASKPRFADHAHCLHTRRHRPRYKVVLRRKLKLKLAILTWAYVVPLRVVQAKLSMLLLCMAGDGQNPGTGCKGHGGVRIKHPDNNPAKERWKNRPAFGS